jgi:hypothetical protein
MAKKLATDKSEQPRVPPPDMSEAPPPQPNGAGTSIPSPDAPKNPSKFGRFKVSEKIVATAGEAAVVEAKKPENGVFFRTHPDPEMYVPVHCFERRVGGKRLYPIDPTLSGLPELEGMTKRVMFVPYITQFGGMGVWPISIDYEELAWIKSALHICDEAKSQWVSAISVKKQQAYRLQPASKDFGPPPWPPQLDQDKILELASVRTNGSWIETTPR